MTTTTRIDALPEQWTELASGKEWVFIQLAESEVLRVHVDQNAPDPSDTTGIMLSPNGVQELYLGSLETGDKVLCRPFHDDETVSVVVMKPGGVT